MVVAVVAIIVVHLLLLVLFFFFLFCDVGVSHPKCINLKNTNVQSFNGDLPVQTLRVASTPWQMFQTWRGKLIGKKLNIPTPCWMHDHCTVKKDSVIPW